MRRKNFNNGHGMKNLKMDDKVYQLRRRVMNYINRARKVGGPKLPRVDVRITENHHGGHVLGIGLMGDCIVWFPKQLFNEPDHIIAAVTYHELCHAIFSTEHNNKCPLMAPSITRISLRQADRLFKKYYDKFYK